jgi:hypothetical protein
MRGIFHNLLIRGALQSRGNNLLNEASASGKIFVAPASPRNYFTPVVDWEKTKLN